MERIIINKLTRAMNSIMAFDPAESATELAEKAAFRTFLHHLLDDPNSEIWDIAAKIYNNWDKQ